MGADVTHELHRGGVGLRLLGTELDEGEGPVLVGGGQGDSLNAVELGEVTGQALNRGDGTGGLRDVGNHDDGGVVALAVGRGDGVVGLALLRPLLGETVVGQGQAQAAGGDGAQSQEDDDGADVHPGAAGHCAHPAGRRPPVRVRAAGSDLAAAREQTLPEDADESRDDRQGHEHGHRHDRRRGQSHRGQEPDAGHAQTAQGHDDRGTGEDDGPSGGGGGPPCGLGRLDAVGEVLTRPRDDEQCVVDADRQSDHDGQDQGGGVDVGDARRREDAEHAGSHTDGSGDERGARSHEGTEGDEQDDRGDGDADELNGGDTDPHLLVDVAAALDRQRRVHGLGALGEGIEVLGDGLGLRRGSGGDGADRGVRLHLDEHVGAVGGDGRRHPGGLVPEGWGDRGDAVDLRGPKGEGVDSRGVVLDAAVGAGDEDLLARAGRLGKPVGEDLQAPHRLGTGDGEGVVELDTGGGDDATEGSDEQRPGGEDPGGVTSAPSPQG